jgi:transcriptional regulator with XRE-family HTH domain
VSKAERRAAGSVDELSTAIASNLQAARRRQGLSLRELAARSGVSKALLSRIEHGAANPSLGTLWRLVAALEMPFSELTRVTQVPSDVVRAAETPPAVTEDGSMGVRALFDSGEPLRFEVYELTMPPDRQSRWSSHGRGTREYSIVIEGDVTVTAGADQHRLSAGDGVVFSADQDHAYETGSQATRLVCIVAYGG